MTDTQNQMTNPSIPYFELTNEQVFTKGEAFSEPTIVDGVTLTEKGVAKNTIRFEREEDIIVCLLSFFVHDYVHDYNLGHNHARVVKGNQTLFESLNITIGNPVVKLFMYSTGKRDAPVMYNDDNYEDVPVETEPKEKQDFVNYCKQFELGIATLGGAALLKQNDETIQSIDNNELTTKPISPLKKTNLETEIKKSITIEPIVYEDVQSILKLPFIQGIEFKKIIDTFEKNADFLNFHSSLNTYVATYLGYDATNSEEGLQNTEGEDTNSIMNNAIRESFDYIINDFGQQKTEKILFFRDIFKLLKQSYELIYNNEPKINPLDILNSSQVLYQFIVFYVSYLSVTNYDEFNKIINGIQTGGEGEDEEETDTSLSPDISEKEIIGVPEYVFVTHNNLLTTIARGMFVKLGIWKKLFPTQTNYNFGIEEINQITYDRLVELYPINQELGGNKNNELLILEILILKRLLLEMSPSKSLTFGAKIDDYLKDYMDTFYFDYFIKNNPLLTTSDTFELKSEIQSNPTLDETNPEQEQEAESFFKDCDENCEGEYDNNQDSYGMYGGGPKKAKPKQPVEFEIIEETDSKMPAEEDIPLLDISTIMSTSTLEPGEINPNKILIQFPKPPEFLVFLNKLQKMYQNNISTIKLLEESKITPITVGDREVDNLYSLLALNGTLMHKKGTTFNVPAPRYKFIINNAAGISSNLNGSRMFILNKYLQSITTIVNEIKQRQTVEPELTTYTSEIETKIAEVYKRLDNDFIKPIKMLKDKHKKKPLTFRELNELNDRKLKQKILERTEIISLENTLFLLKKIKENPGYLSTFEANYEKWFKNMQPIFGVYRTLQRAVFCPTSSMMDAMDNCSLKYNTTEPKEVGTSYSEIIYEKDDVKISFGGVVLNYEENTIDKKDGIEQRRRELVAKIYYELNCNNPSNDQINDIATINTTGIKVSKSDDLKARIAYTGVISKLRNIYSLEVSDEPEEIYGGSLQKGGSMAVIKEMWAKVQYYVNKDNFNNLLASTALKSMGDYLQECQACFKWGGYVNTPDQFPVRLKEMREINFNFNDVKDKLIYRSVSKPNSIIPYDLNGNGLRLGVQKDRPSGFRSIYILLNGHGAINDQAITGYMSTSSSQNPSRSLLVSRNMGNINNSGLMGNVIYVTRELTIPDKDSLLKSLEFLNIKDKKIKVQGNEVIPEINSLTIIGSDVVDADEDPSSKIMRLNLASRIKPLKNSDYEEWTNYEEPFEPTAAVTEIEEELTDQEEARLKRKERAKHTSEEKEQQRFAKLEEKKQKAEASSKIKTQLAEAKILINKKLGKGQKAKITLEDLDNLSQEDKLSIESSIYQMIDEQAKKEQIEKEQSEKEGIIKQAKAAETKAKNKRNKELLETYESSPEGTKMVEERGELQSQIDELTRQIDELKTTKKRGEKISDENLAKIAELEEQIKNREETIETLNRQIKLEAGIIGGGNYTRANKKVKKQKITKRGFKKKNKLTKRNKKNKYIRQPRKTRKNISL